VQRDPSQLYMLRDFCAEFSYEIVDLTAPGFLSIVPQRGEATITQLN